MGAWWSELKREFTRDLVNGLAVILRPLGKEAQAVADLLGLGWFEGGFLFGGAHAFFRVLAGYLWAIVGYTARRFKS